MDWKTHYRTCSRSDQKGTEEQIVMVEEILQALDTSDQYDQVTVGVDLRVLLDENLSDAGIIALVDFILISMESMII